MDISPDTAKLEMGAAVTVFAFSRPYSSPEAASVAADSSADASVDAVGFFIDFLGFATLAADPEALVEVSADAGEDVCVVAAQKSASAQSQKSKSNWLEQGQEKELQQDEHLLRHRK